ncbi:unannotated protein [freshwater metagenome]|uniref:Unannotated protein n=1 Tax=freshwater metagenome TaxID=449393 RepID=A0A6J7C9B2_9ZZZZ
MPWNAIIGTVRPGAQSDSWRTPATGAAAATRSGIQHATREVIIAPLDMPAKKTRLVSMQVLASASSNMPSSQVRSALPEEVFHRSTGRSIAGVIVMNPCLSPVAPRPENCTWIAADSDHPCRSITSGSARVPSYTGGRWRM